MEGALKMLRYHKNTCCFSRVQLFWDLMDCSPPGSSLHGISQARVLEWVAKTFSRASSWPWDRTCVSCIVRQILNHQGKWKRLSRVWLFATPWTITPPSIGFPRKEYWRGLPVSPPGSGTRARSKCKGSQREDVVKILNIILKSILAYLQPWASQATSENTGWWALGSLFPQVL